MIIAWERAIAVLVMIVWEDADRCDCDDCVGTWNGSACDNCVGRCKET